jgi:type VI secretion system protein ImpE
VESARKLYEAGKLNDAIDALGAELRDNPSDAQRRTFLFELLCFAGQWDRADKQLDILAGMDLSGAPANSKDQRIGALLYRAAIGAERTRHEMFKTKTPENSAAAVSGILNGQAYQSISDADPRIGARLEVLAGGNYLWIPLEHIASIEMEPPKRLRDLLWAPATVRTGAGFHGAELGEVLLPVVSPFSCAHSDDNVRLGRLTVWESIEGGVEVPFGQKMLLADGEEIPILELRKLEIRPVAVN